MERAPKGLESFDIDVFIKNLSSLYPQRSNIFAEALDLNDDKDTHRKETALNHILGTIKSCLNLGASKKYGFLQTDTEIVELVQQQIVKLGIESISQEERGALVQSYLSQQKEF